MNVLGKIKSKRQNDSNTQVPQIIQEKKQPQKVTQYQFPGIYKSQIPQQKLTQNIVENKKTFKPIKPVQQIDYVTNTNVFTKQKETVLKQKQSCLAMTRDSTFFTSFQSYKPSKNSNSIVYYDSNPSGRSSSFQIDESTSNFSSKLKKAQSCESEEDLNVDFEFLLSNKQKKEVRTLLHLSKGKAQNVKEIQSDLKAQNQEVLCFYMKKWYAYGDIFMLEGELESLKKGYILLEISSGKRKVHNKMKIKLSCGRDVLTSLESIKIIYLSQVSFLSQNQGMIVHEYFLRAIEKSRNFRK